MLKVLVIMTFLKISTRTFWLLILAFLSGCSLFIIEKYETDICVDKVKTYLSHNSWSITHEDAKIIEFKKGASIVPTFNYDNEDIEVLIILEKQKTGYKVEVGNYGMYPELILMKDRFKRISSKLNEYIANECGYLDK